MNNMSKEITDILTKSLSKFTGTIEFSENQCFDGGTEILVLMSYTKKTLVDVVIGNGFDIVVRVADLDTITFENCDSFNSYVNSVIVHFINYVALECTGADPVDVGICLFIAYFDAYEERLGFGFSFNTDVEDNHVVVYLDLKDSVGVSTTSVTLYAMGNRYDAKSNDWYESNVSCIKDIADKAISDLTADAARRLAKVGNWSIEENTLLTQTQKDELNTLITKELKLGTLDIVNTDTICTVRFRGAGVELCISTDDVVLMLNSRVYKYVDTERINACFDSVPVEQDIVKCVRKFLTPWRQFILWADEVITIAAFQELVADIFLLYKAIVKNTDKGASLTISGNKTFPSTVITIDEEDKGLTSIKLKVSSSHRVATEIGGLLSVDANNANSIIVDILKKRSKISLQPILSDDFMNRPVENKSLVVSGKNHASGTESQAVINPDDIKKVQFVRLLDAKSGNTVGVRAITNIGRFDMTKGVASKVGLTPRVVQAKERLISHNGLLVSQFEIENHIVVQDISNDLNFCRLLVKKALSNS